MNEQNLPTNPHHRGFLQDIRGNCFLILLPFFFSSFYWTFTTHLLCQRVLKFNMHWNALGRLDNANSCPSQDSWDLNLSRQSPGSALLWAGTPCCHQRWETVVAALRSSVMNCPVAMGGGG